MISIVQNFICTKEERLQVLREYLPMIGDVFGECEFYVNYNSTINLDEIYSLYKQHIPKLNFYNDLSEEWAPVTLALAKQITTPYTLFLCEDTQIHVSKQQVYNRINEFIELDCDYLLLTKLEKYLRPEYINGYTPYNQTTSPGYQKLKYGYSYLGKHAPHKRLSTDAVYKSKWYQDRLEEFILNIDQCKHHIPIRDKRKPNCYEGYYDFDNGMSRFAELKCYIPDEVIISEFDGVKQNS
jgi:hypothetical protein